MDLGQQGNNIFAVLGQEIGQLVNEKHNAYGDSVGLSPKVLSILYPNGVKPEQYGDLLSLVRVIDKLTRIARGNKDAFGENPWQDIIGYGLRELAKEREVMVPVPTKVGFSLEVIHEVLTDVLSEILDELMEDDEDDCCGNCKVCEDDCDDEPEQCGCPECTCSVPPFEPGMMVYNSKIRKFGAIEKVEDGKIHIAYEGGAAEVLPIENFRPMG